MFPINPHVFGKKYHNRDILVSIQESVNFLQGSAAVNNSPRTVASSWSQEQLTVLARNRNNSKPKIGHWTAVVLQTFLPLVRLKIDWLFDAPSMVCNSAQGRRKC